MSRHGVEERTIGSGQLRVRMEELWAMIDLLKDDLYRRTYEGDFAGGTWESSSQWTAPGGAFVVEFKTTDAGVEAAVTNSRGEEIAHTDAATVDWLDEVLP